MEKYKYTAKTYESALETALYELKEEEKNIVVINQKEIKAGLFGKKVEIELIKKSDIISEIKAKITEIVTKMGLEPKLEVKNKDDVLNITIFSNNDSILIGKQGRTIDAITQIIRQSLFQEYNIKYKFNIDVSEYKLKRQKDIEYLAKRIAKEVQKTKIDAKMDSMNSYERRIVHNILNDWNNIKTESEGIEPDRYVVIKYKG